MPMYLDGSGPLFQQVYRALRDGIVAGRFAVGTRLPPTRALATDLGVSRATVLLAYEQLAAEGYAGGKQGSGTYAQGPVSGDPGPLRAAPAGGGPRPGALAAALLSRRRLPLESAYERPTALALGLSLRHALAGRLPGRHLASLPRPRRPARPGASLRLRVAAGFDRAPHGAGRVSRPLARR